MHIERNKLKVSFPKICYTIFLTTLAISCFIFMPPSRSFIIKDTTIVSTHHQRTEERIELAIGIAKLLEWLGFGLLIFSVWIWRKELGVTQLGPVSWKDSITQQEAVATPKDKGDPEPTNEVYVSLSKEMADAVDTERLKQILQMFRKTRSIKISYVAHELGISLHLAKLYLYQLTKNGQLRADGFPNKTIYTLMKSIENRVLDAVRNQIAKNSKVLAERRYVKINSKYEIDAIIETDKSTFLIETKTLHNSDILLSLDIWVRGLLKIANELPPNKIICILAVFCTEDLDTSVLKKEINSITYDSGTIPIQVHVFSENDLVKQNDLLEELI